MSDSGGDANGGDDLSGLTGFFFYAFIVHPATAWILKPGRFERKKSIMYAIGFLAALASLKTGLELKAKGPNYYAKLNVTRDSNPLAIKRAYKKLSLQLHPDKNPSPDASAQFDALKKAYDVLIDMELRQVYDKFGAEGIAKNKRFDETRFFIELGVFYTTWGMMTFMLTLGRKSGDARQWVFTGLILMLVIEIALMTTQENVIPTWLFPRVTEYECVWLLHSLFPAFMNGCRSLGSYLYVDVDAQGRALLLALQEQNKDILLVLRDVQIMTQGIQANGGGGGGHRLANATTSTAGLPVGDKPSIKVTPTGKLKELSERMQANSQNVNQVVHQMKKDGSSGNSSLGFYAMILGYVAFSYIFNSN
eukprot:CAMPEP_0172498422 /NCGR_PEP_ID=MMETSP1066-20121228/113418_1 /TAXON_ID=671091 /ORGANISM="Coscinodiscus wailesii, Strain CCMP2513" /LENGTH=363 /DNA_ID=CAMNT_0013271699 /DNA_START=154 /DNA_END=1245 /DNA_ORIENTATION=+